jgi:hypothetical protein
MKKILIILMLLAAAGWGATYTLESAEFTVCSTAVATASSGDTIIIPEDTATWSKQILWTDKNLKIMGAGKTKTKIEYTGSGMFKVTTYDTSKCGWGVSHINAVSNSSTDNTTIVVESSDIDSFSYGWVVHDMRFYALKSSPMPHGISIKGSSHGVIYNCDFDTIFGAVSVYAYRGDEGSGTKYGDRAWEIPISLGSKNAVYVEDCNFRLYDGRLLCRF